ncbi:MAG: CpaF family protein [Dehalococcoidia bacterium]|nr:CpaF family protein [Dehalococcoidia bacterium]
MTQVWNQSSRPSTGAGSGNGLGPLGGGLGAGNAANLDDREIEDQLHTRLIRDLDDSVLRGLDNERVREQVEAGARTIAGQLFPSLAGDRKEEIVTRVVDEVLGLGPIEPLLRDPTVSEVMVNGPFEVFFERDGLLHEADTRFRDNAHVYRMIDRIVSAIGRHVDEASPMVDARLADGSRVNVIIPPLVPGGPVVTIRRFLGDRYTMSDLAAIGTLSGEMELLLQACVRAKLSIVVSGGTGSGKTTLLNALSAYIPHRERIVTVEDPIELKLQQKHTISMEARPPSTEGKGEVTQRSLVRNALRMRPDRMIVGEVRGSEAFDMLQAMNTGHEGSMTTVHANSARDALARVENMVLMSGFELPVTAIRDQMASAFDVIVQLSRMADGTRKITSLTEVTGTEGNTITMQDLFVFRQTGIDAEGRVLGEARATGIRPTFSDRLQAYGIDLGSEMFGVGRWG